MCSQCISVGSKCTIYISILTWALKRSTCPCSDVLFVCGGGWNHMRSSRRCLSEHQLVAVTAHTTTFSSYIRGWNDTQPVTEITHQHHYWRFMVANVYTVRLIRYTHRTGVKHHAVKQHQWSSKDSEHLLDTSPRDISSRSVSVGGISSR